MTCLEPGLISSEFGRHYPEEFRDERLASPSLSAKDMADVVWWLWTLPDHVDIGELVVRHVAQR